MSRLKIGVLGAGHLGKIHIQCLRDSGMYELSGFYDPDHENAASVEKDFGIRRYHDADTLIDEVEVVDIVTPTLSHFDNAVKALRKTRHVFIEKPVVTSPDEARKLITLAKEANAKAQVGHVERFNPAFLAALPYFDRPMFIETHRLSSFNPRGTDVPVVLDLMIHDIDIVLSIVNSGIRRISASGVPVVTDTPDIANARIEFDNGCVANLTASRISMKKMRKSRFFQKDAYISVDFLEKKLEIIRLRDIPPGQEPDPLAITLDLGEGKGMKQLTMIKPELDETNAIRQELESFAEAILSNKTPAVTIEDGYQSLDLAYRIMEKMGYRPDEKGTVAIL
ncbi:MAG: Gfo/Idh/MocA family oxidoreductase [Bacteroidales bacterium]|nr:Gfo/Idh/MocA family oxidoreductase [Bacteroidales bacterium]